MIYPVRGKCNVAMRDRTADLLNAIAPEVLDSAEMVRNIVQNSTKQTILPHILFQLVHGVLLCFWY